MNDRIKLFERHLKEEEKAKNTINKYLSDIKEFYEWYGKKDNVTKDVLLDYKEHLKKSKLKVSTINSKISSLNAFFTYTKNQTLRLKVIKCQKSLFGSKEKELTKKEYKRLYEASKSNEKLRRIVETIVKTGARVSEIEFITYESLNTGKAIVDNKGKIRTILLPRKLNVILKDYCRKVGISAGPIFITRNGTPMDRKQIWQMMKILAFKAGVPKEKVFPHNLRHLFARELYKQTYDIVKLASLLGHSSIETTRIYTKETEDECREDLEKLDFAT